MKKVISGFVFLTALSLSTASAAVSIESARKAAELGGDIQKSYMIKLVGVSEGLMYANAALEAEGREKLYCQPDNLALNGETIYGLTNTYIERLDIEIGLDWPFEMFILQSLKDAFPCD